MSTQTSGQLDLSFAAGRRYAVLGLARSGIAAARELKRAGAEVLAWDDGEKARAKVAELGLAARPLDGIDWSGIEALVLSFVMAPRPMNESKCCALVTSM